MSGPGEQYQILAESAIEDAMDHYDVVAEQQVDELCNVLKARRAAYLRFMQRDVAACRARIEAAVRDGTDVEAAARLGMSTRVQGSG
jgi:hypothetical protein